MGLFKKTETRAAGDSGGTWFSADTSQIDSLFGAGQVKEAAALQNAAVWYCVTLIADAISTQPVDIFTIKNGERECLPTPTWLTKPGPNQTSQTLWQSVLFSLLIYGNAYIYAQRDNKNQIVSVQVLPAKDVEVTPTEMGFLYSFAKGTITFTDKEVLHIRGIAGPDDLKGHSPIDAARQAIDLGAAADNFGQNFLNRGITLSGVIQYPTGVKMEPEETKRLRNDFQSAHSGRNSAAVGILTNGGVWQSITITPEQAQFLETKKFNNVQIGNFFRVPAYLLDPTVASTWGSGIEEQNLFFVQNTLMPWIVRIEQAVSSWLLPGNQFLKFNMDSRIRPNTATRYAAHASAITNGWMTRNEVRALEDLEPVEGGDYLLIPLNYGYLDEFGNIHTATGTEVIDLDAAEDKAEGEENPDYTGPAIAGPADSEEMDDEITPTEGGNVNE